MKVAALFDRMMENFGIYRTEQLARSWCMVDRHEKRLRLKVIRALVLELEEIRKVDCFSTGLGESAIESVIEGDWKDVLEHATWFTWEDDPETAKRYAPLWAKFVAILQTAKGDVN